MLFYSAFLLEKTDKIVVFGGIKVVFCLNLESFLSESPKKTSPQTPNYYAFVGLLCLYYNLFFSVCDRGHDHVRGHGDGRGCTLRVRLLSTLLIRI